MRKSEIALGQVEIVAAAVNLAMQHTRSYGARFKLREILRSLAPHSQDMEAEKQALIAEYAVKDEAGAPAVRGDVIDFGDNEEEVDRRWRELVATRVSVQHKLTLEDVAELPADAALDALELLLI